MGERYSVCCNEEECLFCGGTGFSGEVNDSLRNLKPQRERVGTSASWALESAVYALNKHTRKQREKKSMSIPTVVQSKDRSLAEKFNYTDGQMDLIRNKVCKNASDEELEHFFYKCVALKLDPLMGQIYFVKFGNSPGTIIIGIDGYRMRAQATGKLTGIKRGVIRDKNGVCTGAWAQVFRADWKEPASEEVSLQEYTCNKPNWQKMPETMIKKVAEAAALRMAFPDAYNGIYAEEEMDRARDTIDVPSEVQGAPNRAVSASVVVDRKPSEAQLKRLFAISREAQVTHEQVKDYIQKEFSKTSSKDLSLREYDQLCDVLQSGILNQVVPPISEQEEPIEVSDSNEDLEVESNQVPWAKYRDPSVIVK